MAKAKSKSSGEAKSQIPSQNIQLMVIYCSSHAWPLQQLLQRSAPCNYSILLQYYGSIACFPDFDLYTSSIVSQQMQLALIITIYRQLLVCIAFDLFTQNPVSSLS